MGGRKKADLVFGAASNEFAIGRRGDASDPF